VRARRAHQSLGWLHSSILLLLPAALVLRGSCSPPLSVQYYLPRGRFEYVGSYAYRQVDDRPDIFIATTRWACDRRFKGRVVHTVEREGVPLLFVKERAHAMPPRTD
jgi:hypothetical protein